MGCLNVVTVYKACLGIVLSSLSRVYVVCRDVFKLNGVCEIPPFYIFYMWWCCV